MKMNMKKVVLIVSTVILSLGCLYAFAICDELKTGHSGSNYANFEDTTVNLGGGGTAILDMKGTQINKNDNSYEFGYVEGQGSTYGVQRFDAKYNTIRQFTTPSRNTDGAAGDDYLDAAVIVENIAGNDTQCLHVTDQWAAVYDKGSLPLTEGEPFYFAADIRPENVTGFTGLIAYTESLAPKNPAIGTSRGEDWDLVLNYGGDNKYTGFGFTFLKNDKNNDTVRLFINGFTCENADYLDINLGLGDLTTAWHNYALFLDPGRKLIYFAVDGKVYGLFYVDQVDTPFVSVYDKLDEYSAGCINAGGRWVSGNAFAFPDTFAWVGSSAEGCTVYMDNIATGNYDSAADVGKNPRIDLTQSGGTTVLQPKDAPTDPMLSGISVVVNSQFDVYIRAKNISANDRDNYRIRITPHNTSVFSELTLELNDFNECSFRYIDFDEIYEKFNITLLQKNADGNFAEIRDENNEIKKYTQLKDWTMAKYLMFDLVVAGNKDVYTLAADIARLGSAIRVYFYNDDNNNENDIDGWLTPMASVVTKNNRDTYKPSGTALQAKRYSDEQTLSVQLHIDYDFKLRFNYNSTTYPMASAKMYKMNGDVVGDEVQCNINLKDSCVSTKDLPITDLKTRYKVEFFAANGDKIAYVIYSVQDYVYAKFKPFDPSTGEEPDAHTNVIQSVAPLCVFNYNDVKGLVEKERINQEIINFKKNDYADFVSFIVTELDGTPVISENATEPFCTQSTIKAPYVCSLLEANKKLLDSNVQVVENVSMHELIKEIITTSNDSYYDKLRDYCKSKASYEALGLERSGEDIFYDWCFNCGVTIEKDVKYPKNLTVTDMAKFWKKIYAFITSDDAPEGFAKFFIGKETTKYSAIYGALKAKEEYIIYTKSGWENGYSGDPDKDKDGIILSYTDEELDQYADGDPSDDEFATNDTGVVVSPKGVYILCIFTDIPTNTAKLSGLIQALDDYYQTTH